MNKINSPIINKKYQHNMIMMIVAAVLVVLSFICFAAGDLGSALRNDEAAVHFSEAYNDEKLDEGKRVMIYATEDPVQIGYYDSSEAYYFVYDYYEDLYIIRCSEDQADAISQGIKKDGYVEVEGSIYTLTNDVIDEAITFYVDDENNEDELKEARDYFDEYFMGKALWVKDADPEPAFSHRWLF